MEPGVGKWVSYLNREKKLDSMVGPRPKAPPAPKGLYIYGNVGSGMLLDIVPYTRKACLYVYACLVWFLFLVNCIS